MGFSQSFPVPEGDLETVAEVFLWGCGWVCSAFLLHDPIPSLFVAFSQCRVALAGRVSSSNSCVLCVKWGG